MAQDVSDLKDFQLGDCLGKGAFGSVYRALNWGTGETVAVKQIKLVDLPKSELRVIMLEIDLLKNLDHPNIVKYHGFVKSAETLNIILEYCENGSLHSISKNFGRFPENLVGLYMSQVLHGLLYLHEQGVIHRDIKGANILTTKEGLVKLADFGVASRTTGLREASVVGTPYWMAPEVIELSGATTASDIWSLGCTVIELLEGKPPYYKLQPMPALFRIVNDDHPPLPQGASPVSSTRNIIASQMANITSGRSRFLNAVLPERSQSSRLCKEAAETPVDRECSQVRFCGSEEVNRIRRSCQECPGMERGTQSVTSWPNSKEDFEANGREPDSGARRCSSSRRPSQETICSSLESEDLLREIHIPRWQQEQQLG